MELRVLGVGLGLAMAASCVGPAGENGSNGVTGDQGPIGDQGIDGDDSLIPGEPGGSFIIDVDTSWTTDTAIEGTVFVEDGVTLTIGPGVELEFFPGAGLFVEGKLVVNGTAGNEVVLLQNTSFPELIKGVYIGGSTDLGSIDHLRSEGINLTVLEDGIATLSNSAFVQATLSVHHRDSPLTLSDLSFLQVGDDERISIEVIEATDLTIDGVTFNGGAAGVSATGAGPSNITVFDLSMSGDLGCGVCYEVDSAVLGTIDIDGATNTGPIFAPISVHDVDLTVNDATLGPGIWDAVRSQGSGTTTITNSTFSPDDGFGALVEGPLFISDTVITDCNDNGIQVDDDDVVSTVTNVSVQRCRVGLHMSGGTVTNSEFVDNTGVGIRVWTSTPVTISACDISNNGDDGITGRPTVTVTGNNIIGNTRKGIQSAGGVDGNFVSGNDGEIGVDLFTGGTVDGTLDTDSQQIQQADAISNPQSSPVAGTGPQ